MAELYPPSKGCFRRIDNPVDPCRLGLVFWAKTESRMMVPYDLHGFITLNDEENLNVIAKILLSTRKTEPVLNALVDLEWDDWAKVRQYVIWSIETRRGAVSMKADGSWDEFWAVY